MGKTNDEVNNKKNNSETYTYHKFFLPVKVSLVSGILLLIVLGLLSYIFAPVTYIKIESNTTKSIIELSLNRFDHVIDITILDDNGEVILKDLSLNAKGKNFIKSIDIILKNNYFNNASSYDSKFTITVNSRKVNKALKIHFLISNYMRENGIYEEQHQSNG